MVARRRVVLRGAKVLCVQDPVPVFIYKPRRGRVAPGRTPPVPERLLAADAALTEDDCRLLTVEGCDVWILMTYHRLRAAGFEVELSERLLPGRMCIVHYDHLSLREVSIRSFVVAIQPDRPRPHWCDARIVQNPTQVRGPRDFLVPHWPQPGLVRRGSTRPPRISGVSYFGRAGYLAPLLRSAAFSAKLRQLGATLRVVTDPGRWHDYREADAVLAVRDVSPFDLSIKPPSKLVNAWHAGAIPMVGPEPAYRALRTSPLDYVEVTTPESVLQAVARLNANPDEVRRRIERGHERARDFTVDAVVAQWAALLSGPLRQRYFRWTMGDGAVWRTRRSLASVAAIAAHKYERQRFRRLIRWTPSTAEEEAAAAPAIRTITAAGGEAVRPVVRVASPEDEGIRASVGAP